MRGPGWPEVRGWAIIGFFALTFALLLMIDRNPGLLKDSSFMQFAQALATGGILLVATNLFGGTKSGAETNAALAASVGATAAGAPVTPAPGTASMTAAADVTATLDVKDKEPDA